MLNNIFQPYHTMQEINLDWILTKVKNILRFVPDDGAVGQILRRTAHGAEWSNEQGGGGAVDSVNGQTGTVVLTASDVGALPDTYVAPVTSVNGQTGDVIVSGGAVDSVNGQTGTVVLGKSDIGLGNVDNVQQYSATNPPPYPVTSVNSQTGAVTLSIPTDTGDLTNGAGYVTAAGAASAAPVQSVNGQTGTVVIPTGGRTLLWTNPNPNASFASQTINLPAHTHSSYQIIGKFRYNASYSLGPFEGLVGESIMMNSPACSNIISGVFTGFILRVAQTTATQITFGTGEIAFNTATTNNDYMIPLRVYGID